MKYRVVAFDFDGVILESAETKTEAFRKMFEGHPDQVAEIVQYHQENMGISRYVKFRHIYEEMLRKPYSDEVEKELGNRFTQLVFDEVLTCPFVAGAEKLVHELHAAIPLYVVSGTPEEELLRVVEARNLGGFFRKVYGSPRTKPDLLREILAIEKIQPSAMLFVGDATTDLRAAAGVGADFAGRGLPEDAAPIHYRVNDLNDLRAAIMESAG